MCGGSGGDCLRHVPGGSGPFARSDFATEIA